MIWALFWGADGITEHYFNDSRFSKFWIKLQFDYGGLIWNVSKLFFACKLDKHLVIAVTCTYKATQLDVDLNDSVQNHLLKGFCDYWVGRIRSANSENFSYLFREWTRTDIKDFCLFLAFIPRLPGAYSRI